MIAKCFRMFYLMLHFFFCHISTTSSDASLAVRKYKIKFPELKALSYNVSVAVGATARLPCTVTNVEHQAVTPHFLFIECKRTMQNLMREREGIVMVQ